MKLYMHNFEMRLDGIFNPVTGLLKVGMLYPTPKGNKPIIKIEYGCLIF